MTGRDLFVARDPARVAAWCHEHLAPGAIYVAPSAAARHAARRFSLGAKGVGVGARIISASGLMAVVEARAGLTRIEGLSPALSRLLLIEAGRRARVPLFDAAPPSGAVAALGRLIRDLRLNAVTPEGYVLAGGDPRAADAYRLYEERRAGLGLVDEADVLTRATTALPRLGTVILEDPVVSSRLDAEFLRALAERTDAVYVGVPELAAPPVGGIAESSGPVPMGPAAAALAFFRGLGFAETHDGTVASAPEIASLSGVGPDGEVALVARHMLQLIRAGTSPEEILGAAPAAGYLARLHDACALVGVPVASPRRVQVLDVPLVRALLGVFAALADAEEDTAERGLALLGTPYVGLTRWRHDRTHEHLTLLGLGSLRSWKEGLRLKGRSQIRAFADAVEGIAETLASPQLPARFTAVVSRLVLDFGFLSAARRHYLGANRDDALRADQQAWEVLQEAMQAVEEAFARMQRAAVPAREWLGEITAALQGETVRTEHRGVRGVRLTITGGGLPASRHVFAVGWREGVFPRRPREDALLSDEVKARLNATGTRLQLTAGRAAHDEERRDRLVRAASRRLVVSWPAVAADGSPQLRSFYAQDIGAPDAAPAAVGETTWPLDLAADRAESLARVAVLVRHRAEGAIGAERGSLDGLLAGLSAEEASALRGGRHAPQRIEVPSDLAAPIRERAANQSATQVNALAHCLYRHFAERRLEVEVLTTPEVGVAERGTIAHRTLADVIIGGDLASARAAAAFDQRWLEAVPAFLAANAEVAFEGRVLRSQVVTLVEAEQALFAVVPARPAFVELGFGMPDTDGERRDPASRKEGLVLPLPAGSPIAQVVLRGAIDRVDVFEEHGVRYGVAIDYKSGKAKSYGERFDALTDFQLPIYCAVLRAMGIEPVGAVYLGIASGERYGILREDVAERFLPAGTDKGVQRLPAAAFDGRLEQAMNELTRFAAKAALPEVLVSPRDDDCGWCAFAPLCRIGTFGVGRREHGDA